MNKERLLGIISNLLAQAEEDGMIDNVRFGRLMSRIAEDINDMESR